MTTALTESSSRTTAACAGCSWTSDRLIADLTVRVASRQHADTTGHCVALLTSTVTLLGPSPDSTTAAARTVRA